MSYEEEKKPFIINQKNSFVSEFFLSYMQPFFYHKELTIEETMSEWQSFGNIYQTIKSLSHNNVISSLKMEKELDEYYRGHPKLSKLYFDRKIELNIREQQIFGDKNLRNNVVLKDFQMPDREFFETAKAICEYASLNSLRMTYTGYNCFSEEGQKEGIKERLTEFYSMIRESISHALVQNNVGLGVLNINIIDSEHSDSIEQKKRAGNFIPSLKTIEINIDKRKIEYRDIFLHEYTHFLEAKYCSIFESDMKKSDHESLLYKNFNHYDVNATLNKLTHYDFFFSSFNDTSRNNKLYQIFNTVFYEQHADFIKDYEASIYLNITGKNLNRPEMKQELLSINYKILFEPVSILIEKGIIQNTTADNFIKTNEDFLNDFISSLRYHIFNIDNLLNNHDNCFTKFISLQKYMKYKLESTHINPKITEEKSLHSLFIAMIEMDRKIGKQLDAEGSNASTPLYERVHNYYPTVDFFIPIEDFREEALYILVEGRKRNLDVNYFTLPGELLAYSMTNDYDKKPEYIKEANKKFYNKYINYIAEKMPFEVHNFDQNIINNLNILAEKQLLTDNVQAIQPVKLIAASF